MLGVYSKRISDNFLFSQIKNPSEMKDQVNPASAKTYMIYIGIDCCILSYFNIMDFTQRQFFPQVY